MGKVLGYVRVSTANQNDARQLEGEKVDKIFLDKVSGKDLHRPELENLISFAREGDTILVHSMDRLSRNLNDLLNIVEELTDKGITIKFIKEGITFNTEADSTSRLILSIMGSVAEFERALLKERQAEGIEIAKKAGKYSGRKKSLSPDQLTDIMERVSRNESKSQIARDYNITRVTLYRYINAQNATK